MHKKTANTYFLPRVKEILFNFISYRILFFSTLCFGTSVQSMPHIPNAVAFFKSPQSLFESGQTTRAELEKNLQQIRYELFYEIEKENKSYQISAFDILRDYQLNENIELMENSKTFSDMTMFSDVIIENKKPVVLKVIDSKGHWLKVKDPVFGKTSFVPFHWTKSIQDDFGVFITLTDTFLKLSPKENASIYTTIPKGTRLTCLGFKNNWILTEYEGRKAFVELSSLIHKSDFANWAYHPDWKWIEIDHRENEYIIGKDGKKFSMNTFSGWKTYPQKGIIISKEKVSELPLRSHVWIKNQSADIWGLSDIKGHGIVWWKKENINIPTISQNNETITTEQLQKRDIFSVAFNSKNLNQGIASAGGIFLTEDGKSWKKISKFGDQDFPVAIHPDRVWFVGSFRSTDEGKNFEPFIKWDELALKVQNEIHKTPQYLILQKLEAKPQSQLEILLDTGIKKIKLQTHVLGNSWKVISK